MSRATLVLIVVVAAVVIGLVLLSRRPASVLTHRIEQPVTLGGDASGGAGDAGK